MRAASPSAGSIIGCALVVAFDAWIPAHAADVRVAPLEVSAYRPPRQLEETVQSVTVLTAAEIAARNPASLVDLLQQLPGVHVDRAGVAGPANLYLRGADPNQTLVLIDGVRVNDPTDSRGGGYDLSSIAVRDIERVEMLRGASSSLFGADALGGIVNIVTRRPLVPGLAGELRAGGGGRGRGEADVRIDTGGEALAFAAGVLRQRDGRERDGGETDLETINATARIAGERVRVVLDARQTERDSAGFPEASGGSRLAVRRNLEQRNVRERMGGMETSAEIGERLNVGLRVARFDREEHRDSPGVAPGPGGFLPASTSHSDFERTSASVSATLGSLPLGAALSAGVEWRHESGRVDSVLDLGQPLATHFALTRRTRSAFADLRAAPAGGISVVAGARRDAIDGAQSQVSRHAGVRWRLPGYATVLRAHWSEGFRPPSLFALGDPLVGNRELVAETGSSIDFSIEQPIAGDAARLGGTLFRSRTRDLIDFDPSSFRLVNRARTRARGAELDLDARLPARLRLRASYTYVESEVADTGEALRNRPRHRAGATLIAPLGERWQATMAIVRVGRSRDFSIPGGEGVLAAYTRVDATLSWQSGRWRAWLALDNLLGERYEQVIGFPESGFRVRATAGLTF